MHPKIEEFVEYMRGSSNSLNQGLDTFEIDEDELTADDYNYIDSEIFECEECNWWCSQDERSEDEGGNTCQDCFGY